MTNTKHLIGKRVEVIVDRPKGETHPDHPDLVYKVNYGFIPRTKAPDGEEVDAYILGVKEQLIKFKGTCVAIIHRLDDDDDKLIVVRTGTNVTDEEIIALTNFQEKNFKSEIIR